jgi:hypothetical protein
MIIVYILIWGMHPLEPNIETRFSTPQQCEQTAARIEAKGAIIRARCLTVMVDAQR